MRNNIKKMLKIEYKPLNELILDPNNPRFAELYSESKKEGDLIEYLLYTEAAEEVATNISDKEEFHPDEALWVIPLGNKFLVKDGNRRCAAAKALQNPTKYGLELPKMNIDELPVLVYEDQDKLDKRIQEHHTHSLFKEWEPIAKALKALEMHKGGSSEESLREIDSNPRRLINLASFYHEAVKVVSEDFKRLLRGGRGKGKGKTIIFERLFSYKKDCGYKFKSKPSYEIEITNKEKFEGYVKALVSYLKGHPKVTHSDVDNEKAGFLHRLKAYGFDSEETSEPADTGATETNTEDNPQADEEASSGEEAQAEEGTSSERGSVKKKPKFTRKQVAPKLRDLIDECYNLDANLFANAKMALSRVAFEAILKYVIEQTKYEGKILKNYDYFNPAFRDRQGNPHKYTNFDKLKTGFIDLIKETGIKNSFEQFDLDKLHQIIHNYKTGALPSDAKKTAENLIPLIEFMLDEEEDFLKSIDTNKLT